MGRARAAHRRRALDLVVPRRRPDLAGDTVDLGRAGRRPDPLGRPHLLVLHRAGVARPDDGHHHRPGQRGPVDPLRHRAVERRVHAGHGRAVGPHRAGAARRGGGRPRRRPRQLWADPRPADPADHRDAVVEPRRHVDRDRARPRGSRPSRPRPSPMPSRPSSPGSRCWPCWRWRRRSPSPSCWSAPSTAAPYRPSDRAAASPGWPASTSSAPASSPTCCRGPWQASPAR